MHVNNSGTVKTVGGISICDGGKLEESEVYINFYVIICVLESKQITLVCNLLSYKSEFVSQL